MSKFSRKENTNANTLSTVIQNIDSELTNVGSAAQVSGISVEEFGAAGADSQVFADAEHAFEEAHNAISAAIGDGIRVGGTDIKVSDVGLEAAAVLAMWGDNLQDYAQSAVNKPSISTEGVKVIDATYNGGAGAIDLRDQPSTEAFDNQSMSGFKHKSYVFNALAATQDAFSELFFKTIVLTPDELGLDMEVRQTTVMNDVRRSIVGDTTDFGKRSLVDALVDHTILENASNEVIPVIDADENAAGKFVPKSLVPYKTREVNGQELTTSYLATGVKMDLLALSMGAGHVDGAIADSTDALDATMSLAEIVIAVANGAGDKTEVFALDVNHLPSTSFKEALEGKSRDMYLNFSSQSLVLRGATTTVAGVEADNLAALRTGNYHLRLGIKMSGTVNLESGDLEVTPFNVERISLVDEHGDTISMASGAGQTAVADINVSVIGYRLNATRAMTNYRTRGTIVDSTTDKFRYTVRHGAPITALTPVNAKSTDDLKDLVATARTTIANNAVTTLLNYMSVLESTVALAKENGADPVVPGAGAAIIKPHFDRIVLDVEAQINSISTHEKAEDLRALLVDTIRSAAYRMLEDSNYGAALQIESMGSEVKPTLAIGTDPVLQRHIMYTGDERTLAEGMNPKIATTPDARMKNLIVLTFVRDGNDGADPLSFGSHAYMPEAISTVQINRGGSLRGETQVQPRSTHIPHLPAAVVIEVQNLEKLLQSAAGQ